MKWLVKVFLFFALFLISIGLEAQERDHQWLVRNGDFKSGYNGINNLYNGGTCGNYFKLINAKCPGTSVGTHITRNNFLIICEGGYHYNSRNFISDPFQTLNCNGGFIYWYFNNSMPSVKYLYLSDIYEDNDNPANLRIENYSTPPFIQDFPLDIYSNPGTLTSNQDLVRNKNYTVIIPKTIIPVNCSQLILSYNNSVLDTSQIFGDLSSGQVSFERSNSDFNFLTNQIKWQVYTTTHPYLYFNFKVRNTAPFSLDSAIVTSLYCSDTSQLLGKITDTLRAANWHDPNYIKVNCIYTNNNKKWIKYEMQCFNDGVSAVDPVEVTLPFPSGMDATTFKLGNWNYGGKEGCDSFNLVNQIVAIDQLSNIVTVKYNYLDGLDGGAVPVLSYLKMEFCVQARDTTSLLSANILPQLPTTTFMTDVYPIRTIDFKPTNNFQNSVCNCDCRPKRNCIFGKLFRKN
ncbi:MAG: hypothetical protein ABI851_06925 [Saprospiraceae bacterium]